MGLLWGVRRLGDVGLGLMVVFAIIFIVDMSS